MYNSSGTATFNMGTGDVNLYAIWDEVPIALAANELDDGTYDAAYSDTIDAATGGSGSFTYAVTAGSLPGGLNLNSSTGVIAGTASAGGDFTFTITATDAVNAETASAVYGITINKINQTITGTMSYSKTFGDADFALDMAAGSEVTYAIADGSEYITLTDGTVHIKDFGTAHITASAAANANYNAAADVTITLNIAPAGTVAAPTTSAAAGGVEKGDTVTLATTTDGAAIHYTTDGSDPDETDTLYSGAIAITAAGTVKAIAVKPGYTDSAVASFAYTINTHSVTYHAEDATGGSAPVDSGVYAKGDTVTAAAKGTLVRTGYTLTGWSLTDGGAQAYNSSGTATFSMGTSDVNLYAVWDEVPIALTANELNDGTYDAAYSDTIDAATGGSGSFTYAVTAGSLPGGLSLSSSTGVISGTVTATPDTDAYEFTITATDAVNAQTASAVYGITVKKANQTITGTTTYNKTFGDATFNLDMTAKTAVTYALSSGSCVTMTSGGAVTITDKGTAAITASAAANEYYNAAADVAITLNIAPAGTVAAPTASVAAGGVEKGDTATLATTTDGAAIHYTTDGSDPDETDTLYSGAIAITAAGTVKAIAVKPGYTDSAVASFAYTINTHSVTYHAEDATGGSAPVDSGVYAKGDTVTAAAKGTLVRTGYTLTGWSLTDGGAQAYNSSGTATFSMGTSDVNLYAVWDEVPIALTANELNDGTYDAAYSDTIDAATGGSGSFTYAVTAGSLPGGLSLSSSTGVISGTVTATPDTDAYEFTITATDAVNAETASAVYGITVNKANQTITGTTTYNKTFGDEDFALSCAANTDVTYAITDGGAYITLTDGTVHIKEHGTAHITASAAANEYYNAAADVTITVTVAAAGTVAAPTASVAAGGVEKGDTVTLATTTDGAAIHYTTDGSDPDETDTLYSGAIAIAAATTVKALAVKTGYSDSLIASFAYTVNTHTLGYDLNGGNRDKARRRHAGEGRDHDRRGKARRHREDRLYLCRVEHKGKRRRDRLCSGQRHPHDGNNGCDPLCQVDGY